MYAGYNSLRGYLTLPDKVGIRLFRKIIKGHAAEAVTGSGWPKEIPLLVDVLFRDWHRVSLMTEVEFAEGACDELILVESTDLVKVIPIISLADSGCGEVARLYGAVSATHAVDPPVLVHDVEAVDL